MHDLCLEESLTCHGVITDFVIYRTHLVRSSSRSRPLVAFVAPSILKAPGQASCPEMDEVGELLQCGRVRPEAEMGEL